MTDAYDGYTSYLVVQCFYLGMVIIQYNLARVCFIDVSCIALINATPFFLSRMGDSPLKSTFSSYLSTTFTAANFVFLAYATATSKQVGSKLCIISREET